MNHRRVYLRLTLNEPRQISRRIFSRDSQKRNFCRSQNDDLLKGRCTEEFLSVREE